MKKTIKIRVPGTTANCGPGFDSIGIACTIYNEIEFTFTPAGPIEIVIEGEGAGLLPETADNVIIKAVQMVFDRIYSRYPHCQQSRWQGIRLHMNNAIPLSRGLGSSAAAIVAGLVAANELCGNNLNKEEILEIASAMEGHPDNVAPAVYGGITVSVAEASQVHCIRFIPKADFSMVVAIPEFNLSTKLARKVLPDSVPFQDAVFNIGRTALLVSSLYEGKLDFLQYALIDKIHQPYRSKLIPGMPEVFTAARKAGALGAALSGAGPCLIAFALSDLNKIGKAMVNTFSQHNVKAYYKVLGIDQEGAKII
ncbi:MAG TPA: homoserine kinase [Methylomusa anaerophila]|uniref:Homoserine kinase n=1 Tax=Methylomusa anaerophila TaxID=1930071 RepID=A0A348API7_9FIRM|nr:homoserine kinase [Methylomusa anaerophila]BBB92985.1 homoserine kinase [Methylomusa anaerophila]HML87181.1 homoserine kinase [Methylomusa anaerophila]